MKKQSKKRLIALMLSALMLLSLFQNVSYRPVAEGGEDIVVGAEADGILASGSDANLQGGEPTTEATSNLQGGEPTTEAISNLQGGEPTTEESVPVQEPSNPTSADEMQEVTSEVGESSTLDFMDIVNNISISPAGSSSSPINMSQKFRVSMGFVLPTDNERPLSDNYIYSFDLGAVALEGGNPYETVYALIAASSTSTPQPIIMGNEQVGTYTIINGIVTLNFKEGIETLSSPDASRIGEFRFDCGLDEDKLSDEGGEYTLKFTTKLGVDNPKIVVKEKDTINAGIDVVKSNAVFDPETMTATYTITLTNKNDSPVENVVVKDTMGQYLTFDDMTPITSDNGTLVTVNDISDWQHKYNFEISSLPAGTTKLTYVCKVDPKVMMNANNASGSQNGLDNTISATVDGKNIYIDPDKKQNQTTSFTIYKDAVTKAANVSADKTTITWTVVINSGSTPFDMKDCVFQDTLGAPLTTADITADSINIISSKGAGDSNIEGLKNAIENGTSYTFPEGSDAEYTITYETEVPEHTGLESYKNTATLTDDNRTTDRAEIGTEPIGSKISSKAYNGTDDHNDPNDIPAKDGNGDLILPWKTTVKVPQNAGSFIYKDYVKEQLWENGLGFVRDSVLLTAVDGNGSSIALTSGADYTISFTDNGTTHNMEITFTPDGLGKINTDGNTVVTITYNTIGRYHDRTVEDWQMYRNHYEVTVGGITESGDAQIEKNYKTTESTGGISKSAAWVDPATHTVTWKVEVDPGTTPIKDLVLTDVVTDMKYYGYKLDNPSSSYVYDGKAGSRKLAIIRTENYAAYEVEMTETGVDTTDPDHPKYTYAIRFSDDMYLKQLSSYGSLEKNNIKEKITIFYTTQITGSYLEYNNYGTTYTNTVTAAGKQGTDDVLDIGGSSASTQLDTEVLTKKLDTPDNGITSELQYSIRINPDALDLNPDKDYFVIEDELPSSLVFVTNKTIVKDKAGNVYSYVSSAKQVEEAPAGSRIYHVSYNDNIITFTVPDKAALTITYSVNMLMDSTSGSKQFINSVKVEQPYVQNSSQSSSSEYRNISSSSATIYSILFNVEKVNAQDITQRLGGATFTATESEYNTTTQKWVSTGKTYTATTTAGVLLKSTDFTDGAGNHPTENHIYEIKETVAPAGFELTTTTYKIIVLKDEGDVTAQEWAQRLNTADDRDNIYSIMGNTNLVFADMPSTTTPSNKLVINKAYLQADGVTKVQTLPANKATIEIYNNNLTYEQCASGSYTPLTAGTVDTFSYEDSYSAAGHVITLNNIPNGDYTVYEKAAPDGYDSLTRVYHFKVEDYKIAWESGTPAYEISAKLDNKQTYDNQFTINKAYYKAADSTTPLSSSAVPELAEFTYQQTAYWNGTEYVAMTGEVKDIPAVTGQEGFQFRLNKLPAGRYTIREKESNVYETDSKLPCTLEVSANGRISVTYATGVTGPLNRENIAISVGNTIRENEFTIHKEYYDEAGNQLTNTTSFDTDSNQQTVTFVLKKKSGSDFVNAGTSDYQAYEDTTGNTALGDDYKWTNLEPGEYRVVEQKKANDTTIYEPVSDVYFTVDNDYKITVAGADADYTATANVANRALSGTAFRFYVVKQLSNQDGDLTLANDTDGITFELKKNGTEDLSTNLIYKNATKRWESDNLGEGTYTLKETGTKNGYILAGTLTFSVDNNKKIVADSVSYVNAAGQPGNPDNFSVAIDQEGANDGQTIVFTLVNRPNENSITVNKQYYQADKATTVSQAPARPAEFSLYSAVSGAETLVKTLTATGGSCIFNKLEPGSYVIKETYTPAGYTKCNDITFEVKEDYTIEITNSATGTYPSGKTINVQTNNAHGVSVQAANCITNKFKLTKQFAYINGTVVTDAAAISAYMNAATFTLSKGGTDRSASVSKSNNVITISNLEDGTYTLKETGAPAGFGTAGNITLTVTNGVIRASYGGSGRDFTDLYNNNTTEVSATLINRQSENKLIVKKEYYLADGTTPISSSALVSRAGFVVRDSRGNVYTTYTFDSNNGTYTFSNFIPGTYTIRENVPVGFDGVADATFTVDANGKINLTTSNGWTTSASNNTTQVTVTAKNVRKANKLTLSKRYLDVDQNEINGVSGAEFAVQKNGTTVKTMTYNSVSGFYSVENLEPGTYELVETTVPAGYMKPIGTIALNVAQNGTITATYTGGYADDFRIANSGTLVSASIELKNHEVANKLTINKSYETSMGESIELQDMEDGEYAKFRLYKAVHSGAPYEITDERKLQFNKERGLYVFYNLEPGYYEIREEAGAGFEENSTAITFRVQDDKTITNISGADSLSSASDYDKTLNVINKRKGYDNQVTLKKLFINQSNDTADGAEYEALLRDVVFTMKRNGNAVATFGYDAVFGGWKVEHLEPGVYVIEETSTNSDYVLAGTITLTVEKTAPEKTRISARYNGINADDMIVTQNAANQAGIALSLKNHQKVENSFSIEKRFMDPFGNEISDETEIQRYVSNTKFYYNGYGQSEKTEIPYDESQKKWVVEDLQTGTYTVSEQSDENFVRAGDMKLTVASDGNISVEYDGEAGDIQVTETDAGNNETSVILNNYHNKGNVNISKQDITNGEELPGANLTITDEDGNAVVEPWTSSTAPHRVSLKNFEPNKRYTLTEVTAPFGYEVAESIIFMVDNYGNVSILGTDNEFHEADTNTVVMQDAPRFATFSKVDATNGNELPGATIEIKDADGNLIDSWVSTDQKHEILMYKFRPDVLYSMTEITAPEGYSVAETIYFRFDVDGKVYVKTGEYEYTLMEDGVVVMKDAPIDTGTNTSIKTGDSVPVTAIFTLSILAFAGIMILRR